jgi:hypothetical protein
MIVVSPVWGKEEDGEENDFVRCLFCGCFSACD